jgi:hypothetical protein
MAFFADLESPLRIHLRHIEIALYVKKDAKTALAFLAEAKNLSHLRIESGVAMDDDTSKVAKNFWLDASKLLEAVGSSKEKIKVEDKPASKPQVAESKDEESSDEESSEDEEAEDSEEEEEDEDEEEAGDEETEEVKESKDTTSPVVQPTVTQSEAVNEGTVNPAHLELNSLADEMHTITVAPAAMKTEDTVMADNDDDTKVSYTIKKDSKSPAPVVPTKKVATLKPSPKMRQGRKADAVDILVFGKGAFKYKDADKNEHNWDAAMRTEFMDALRAKLK